jgi:hypothetical protein
MKWFLRRLAEPSSSAGVAGAIGAAAAWGAGTVPAEAAVPALAFSILSVFLPERGGPAEPPR